MDVEARTKEGCTPLIICCASAYVCACYVYLGGQKHESKTVVQLLWYPLGLCVYIMCVCVCVCIGEHRIANQRLSHTSHDTLCVYMCVNVYLGGYWSTHQKWSHTSRDPMCVYKCVWVYMYIQVCIEAYTKDGHTPLIIFCVRVRMHTCVSMCISRCA